MARPSTWGSLALALAVISSLGCDDDGGTDATDGGGGGGQAGAAMDAATHADAIGGQAGTAVDASAGGTDGSPADAGSTVSDAAAPKNALFAHIGGKLVSVDTTTGALTELGSTGQTYIVLAWDDAANVARVITDIYSPIGGAATPKLGTINLCTGAITAGAPIKLGNDQVRRAEGLARDPTTGKFHISFGRSGSGAATEFLSESTGTIDVATGAVTLVGNHDTLQDDGDNLMFIGGTLYLLDVASTTNQGAVYGINKTTGAATKVIDTGPTTLRLAHDPTRGLVYAAYGAANGTMRGIATVNIATGAPTVLGTGLPNASYAGENFTGLLSAPTPVCP